MRPPRILSNKAGMHRWVWDMRHAPPAGFARSFPIAAIYRNTPPSPEGPLASPGDYQTRLTVDGKAHAQPLTVRMDPRVTTPPDGLARQHTLSMECYDAITRIRSAQAEVRRLREQLKSLTDRAGSGAVAEAIAGLDKNAAAMEGRTAGLDFFGVSNREPGLAGVANGFLSLMNLLQGADAAPTTQAAASVADQSRALNELLVRWEELKSKDVKSLNDQLGKANLPLVTM
jgi:hypothetical protein